MLAEGTIFPKKARQLDGVVGTFAGRVKGKIPSKSKWYSKEKVEEFIPNILQYNILGTKILPKYGGMIQNTSIVLVIIFHYFLYFLGW